MGYIHNRVGLLWDVEGRVGGPSLFPAVKERGGSWLCGFSVLCNWWQRWRGMLAFSSHEDKGGL